MRLFLFAIGGSGSRVLKSLAMLCAAGVKPVDPATGKPYENLEIIPIIVDPHQAGRDVKRTVELLEAYRKIHNMLYAGNRAPEGFFSTKITTLAALMPKGSGALRDSFLYNMTAVERLRFREFIEFNNLDESNQALMQMLFSSAQLDTSMHIGFVGSPNIGSVALNRFKESDEFRAFGNLLGENDRIFFISSIFGGTGAAGFPIMVKNIRAASDSTLTSRGYMRTAPIGALTLLPYFNIEHSRTSPINKADFLLKTRSALHYYAKSLTAAGGERQVDSIYYLGDKVTSSPYVNDPGEGGQLNAAHLIELIGAMAPLHFLATPEADLGREARAFEYGLAVDTNNVDFQSFDPRTRSMIAAPLLRLHLLTLFLDHKLKDCIGRGFTKDTPSIGREFLSTDFYQTLSNHFLPKYWDWLEEMDENNRHVTLFDLETAGKLENIVKGIPAKKGFLTGSRLTYDDLFARINSVSKKYNGKFTPAQLPLKLLQTFHIAVSQIIDERFPALND
ncbi:MAG: hypothetical protein HDS66_03045 [Bacteroidales bacterium]|nr:hypothetical protein [Bacteroidales bacterium]